MVVRGRARSVVRGGARSCVVVRGRARSCAVMRGRAWSVIRGRAWSCVVVRGRARSVVRGRARSVVRGRAVVPFCPLRGQHCRAARFAASTAVTRTNERTNEQHIITP